LIPSFVLKLFAAGEALEVLDISSLAVLLYTRLFTEKALFLRIVCSC